MFRSSSNERPKSVVAPVKQRPVLSTVAGLTALSAIGLGIWWARKRRH